MSEPTLPLDEPADDLPRALRRERDAQAREAREREMRAGDRGGGFYSSLPDPPSATVTRIDVPFGRLVTFFLKAVLAAIPALILLGVILWFAGEILEWIYPELIRAKITIHVPP